MEVEVLRVPVFLVILTATFDVASTLAGIDTLGMGVEGNLIAKVIYAHIGNHFMAVVLGKTFGLVMLMMPLFALLRMGYVLTFYSTLYLSIFLQIIAGLTWVIVQLGKMFPLLILLQITSIIVAFLIDSSKLWLGEVKKIHVLNKID
jgi:hypothetical protein